MHTHYRQECKTVLLLSENSLAVSYKGKHTLTYRMPKSPPSYLLQRNEGSRLHKNLYTNVCNSSVDNSPQMEATQCPSVGKRLNKPWHIHTMESSSIIKKQSIDLRRYATASMALEGIMPRAKSQSQKVTYYTILLK